ncbi:MAG: CHAT domain-containing protein [Chloroflexi bacterium]|nr:CHAT domain-containing protein [Chloroflexota bacterium]
MPGPPAVVTFNEIAAGVTKDIDVDIKAPRAGASEAGGREPAYRGLLRQIKTNQRRRRIDRGLEELALVASEEQLREVVEQWPEVTTQEAEDRVAQQAESAPDENKRRFASSMLQTVQLCRTGDFPSAWAVRESVIQRFWEEAVIPRQRVFEDAKRGGSPKALAQAGLDLLDILPPGTYPERRAEVAATTVAALLQDEGADRDQKIERAIELGRTVISILDTHPDIDHPQRRLAIATNLSAAFGMRPRGDPAWNLTQGITHLSEALDRFPQAVHPDSWAMAHTNLALLFTYRGEEGDHDRAREHLELTLTHRSFRRSPRDWAFTQLNLGVVYSRTSSGDRRSNLQKAIRHSAKARYAARSVDDTQLLAQAEHNLANEQLELAQLPDTAGDARSRLHARAEASAVEAARLSPITASPLRFGQAWLLIGKIRETRADTGGAIEAYKTALTALSADTGPGEAREASRCLAALAEEQDNVELAADAAARLVEAAAAVISARSRVEDRISERRRRKTTDFRFAAGALARADRLEEAVVALELGRARELGLLTLAEGIDLDKLSHLDPGLRTDVEEVTTSVRADILGSEERSASDSSEQLTRIRAALQQTPTFENALNPPTLEEIGQVAQPERPLVYLGSAPKGSFAIIVDKDSEGGVELEAIHAPDCGSQVIADLAIGLDADRSRGGSAAYLVAQALKPELLDAAITALSPLIGEKLLHPLARSLASRGASCVTLVPAGLLGLMPLHAIAWSDAVGNRRSLIDDFDLAFAPSARLQLNCMRRASQSAGDPVRFVGIADPQPHPKPLEGAEFEIALVERFVPAGAMRVLKGESATKERVLDVLPFATHVHFACHGRGRLFDPLFSAALSLAGEVELSALEVARLEIAARLVVTSACETGVPQGYEEIDELLSLASAFIAAGTAGVVSTLWAIDDFATALIVSRFYEGLFEARKAPATALREAQLWMRDADEAVIDAYASSRAPLRALQSASRSPTTSHGSVSYNAPSVWAAFVFSGA